MKSLEIVNTCLYIIDYNRRQMSEEELLMNIDGYFVKENELKQIKQDLEVLEILRKYLYYIDHTIKLKSISKSVYNFDYEKLKQWLEVNE